MFGRLLAMVMVAAAVFSGGGCASPIPQPTSSPTIGPTPTPTERPSPTAPPSLHIDGLATIVVDELRRLLDPAHPNRQVQPNENPRPLPKGGIALLVDGPRQVAGRDYWQLAAGSGFGPIGWAPATDETGNATLVPFQPACPAAESLTAAAMDSLGGLQALACFGGRELILRGVVTCDRLVGDAIVGGADYFDSNRLCILEGMLTVFGDAVTAILGSDPNLPTVSGTFELRGHMDDPSARGCGWIPFGSLQHSPTAPDPGVVVWCRQNFVVTAVTPAD